jgi:hypothetical protein
MLQRQRFNQKDTLENHLTEEAESLREQATTSAWRCS